MKRLLPLLLILPGLALAKAPRFLGPPVKNPALDGGTAVDAGAAGHAAEADKPLLNPGDEAPLRGGVLYNPEAAGMNALQMSELVGPEAEAPAAKALLVSFFATWCKPCKRELPFLQTLYTEYKDKGLRVVSVAIDKDDAAAPVIQKLLADNKVTFPVVKDRFNLIARQYLGEKTLLPSVFILDKDGKVALVKQGYEKDASTFLKAEVEKALR